MSSAQTEQASQRRLQHCPTCGYALEGLPLEGTCPECGRAYDQTLFVLHGFGRGWHSNFGTAPPRVAYAWASLTTFMFLLMAHSFLKHGAVSRSHDLGMMGVILLPSLVMLLQRCGNGYPGLVQAWLTPEGCGQNDDLHADPTFPRMIRNIGLPLAMTLVITGIVLRDGWSELRFMLIGLAIGGLIVLIAKRRWRSRLRKSSNPAATPLTAWCHVGHIIVQELGDQRYRISITFADGDGSGTPVDIEVKCSDATAADVRRQAEQWLHDARFHHHEEHGHCPPQDRMDTNAQALSPRSDPSR